MAGMSPTQLTLREYRRWGCIVAVVERWCPFSRRRKDLFGWCDLVAICGDEVIGIQATSRSNHSARRKKVLENQDAKIWANAARVIIISWVKEKNRWAAKVEDITDDLRAL